MVVGVKVDAGDRVVSAVRAEGESLLNLHTSGLALAVPLDEYPAKGRGAGGVQSVLVDRPAKSPAGELALVVCQGPGRETDVFTDRGGVYHAAHQDNPQVRRATNSRAFLPLGPGESPRDRSSGRCDRGLVPAARHVEDRGDLTHETRPNRRGGHGDVPVCAFGNIRVTDHRGRCRLGAAHVARGRGDKLSARLHEVRVNGQKVTGGNLSGADQSVWTDQVEIPLAEVIGAELTTSD